MMFTDRTLACRIRAGTEQTLYRKIYCSRAISLMTIAMSWSGLRRAMTDAFLALFAVFAFLARLKS